MNLRIPVILLVVGLLFQAANRSAAVMPATAGAVLEKASLFALGGVGEAGTMSGGEHALRQLLKEPDAVTRLERLLPGASPAGQLSALLGLRIRDRAAYQKALEKFRKNDAKVETGRGCMLGTEPFGDLVKEIERGEYDTFLDRKWPKGSE